jgi:hypothetical protein
MRKAIVKAGLLALAGALLPATSARSDDGLYQLRTYQLVPATKARFHARFRDHAMRIMRRHGFDIAAVWEADHGGRPELVYLLRWTSRSAMDRSWASFMADPDWVRIKRETVSPEGPIVGEIDGKTMRLTDYSPGRP